MPAPSRPPLFLHGTSRATYGPVEGDSASSAELCALLSALAELPVRQSRAVTGSINQHRWWVGQVDKRTARTAPAEPTPAIPSL